MQTAIIKGKGLDDIISKYIPAAVDTPRTTTAPPADRLAYIMDVYEWLLSADPMAIYDRLLQEKVSHNVLSPADIAMFLPRTISYEQNPQYPILTSYLLNLLIEVSYRAGNNNFNIDGRSCLPLPSLGSRMTGNPVNPLAIHVIGEPGPSFAHALQYCRISVEGTILKDSFQSSCRSDIFIDGQFVGTRDEIIRDVYKCRFTSPQRENVKYLHQVVQGKENEFWWQNGPGSKIRVE